MIIECEEDPWKLIAEIGDPSFSICDDDWDECYRHPNHPNTLRIIDCEDNQHIDICAGSVEDTRKTAEALCKLLNQDYWKPGVREK